MVRLEKISNNCNYIKKDVTGKKLDCPIVPLKCTGGQCTENVQLCTTLNVDDLVDGLAKSVLDVECEASVNVGKCVFRYI